MPILPKQYIEPKTKTRFRALPDPPKARTSARRAVNMVSACCYWRHMSQKCQWQPKIIRASHCLRSIPASSATTLREGNYRMEPSLGRFAAAGLDVILCHQQLSQDGSSVHSGLMTWWSGSQHRVKHRATDLGIKPTSWMRRRSYTLITPRVIHPDMPTRVRVRLSTHLLAASVSLNAAP